MSNKALAVLAASKDRFITLNKANDDLLSYEQECIFAKQQLEKNDFTMKTGINNQRSLQGAILNVAAIGISLNPAKQHAYLVPRGGAICLDISFQGLRKIATDSGAIEWAKVELVYKNDTFKWTGPVTVPVHEADPFSKDRGELIGGYCLAKLPSGEYMVEVMKVEEINKIRDTSKASKNGPWVNWYDEMAKKTILKRAFKQWPQTTNDQIGRARLETAISASHDAEGTAYSLEEHAEYMNLFNAGNGLDFYLMRRRTEEDVWNALYNSFDKGFKVKNKEIADNLEKEGIAVILEYVVEVADFKAMQDPGAAAETMSELSEEELKLVTDQLNPIDNEWLSKAIQEYS